MYGRSARVYDLLYTGAGIVDYAAESEELRRTILEVCPGARALLDVACGTGAHLAELRRWFQVEGVDASPAMLEVARSRLPGVPVHQADMRELDLGRRFDAVTCLFSSIGYLTEPSEMRAAVARLAAHVASGGVLVLDGWVRPEDWDDAHRAGPDAADDGATTVVRLSWSRRAGDITELEMHHLVRTAAGIEHFAETHRLRLTPTPEYISAIAEAGLEVVRVAPHMGARDRLVAVRATGGG